MKIPPNIDINLETQKFHNHFLAKTGEPALSSNWFATWKNWILRGVEFNAKGKTKNGKTKSKFDVIDEVDYSEFNSIRFDD